MIIQQRHRTTQSKIGPVDRLVPTLSHDSPKLERFEIKMVSVLRTGFFLRRKRIALFNDVLKASCIHAGLKREIRLVIYNRADDISATILDYEEFEFRVRHDFFDASAVSLVYDAARVAASLNYHIHPDRTVHFDVALATLLAERLDADSSLALSARIKRRFNNIFLWLAKVTEPSSP